jgi:hypothetical protein
MAHGVSCYALLGSISWSFPCNVCYLIRPSRGMMNVDADTRVCGTCMYRFAQNYRYLTSASWRSVVYT